MTAPTLPPTDGPRLDPPDRRLIDQLPVPRWRGRVELASVRHRVVQATVWGVAILVGTLGLTAGLRTPTAVTVVKPAPMPDAGLGAFAVRVVEAAYTFDQADPAAHRAKVAEVVANPADPMLGWDGKGRSTVEGARVLFNPNPPVDNEPRVATIVIVEARIAGVLRTVNVPVTRDPVTFAPALAGVLSLGSAPTPQAQPSGESVNPTNVDTAATSAATDTVVGFLRSWGSGASDVKVYAADGFTPPRSPGSLRIVGQPSFSVPTGGTSRRVLVLVRWADTNGLTYPSAYVLTLTGSGDRWRVSGFDIAASATYPDVPRSQS